MVKGISRRVVVVESPDQRYFEQAIFIVRNEAVGEGVTARELVEEASGWPGTMPAATTDGSAGPGGPEPGSLHPHRRGGHRPCSVAGGGAG